MTLLTTTLLAFALIAVPPPADALVMDWTGTCQIGCIGQALLHFETTDAVQPGIPAFFTPLDQSVALLVARYTDSEVTIDLPPLNLSQLLLPAVTDPSSAEGYYWQEAIFFTSHADGRWSMVGEFPIRADCAAPSGAPWCSERAEGVNGVWADPVPATRLVTAPSALLFLLLGLVILARRAGS